MNRVIWKFQLITAVEIFMPIGAKVCAFQIQGVGPCIWAIVDPDASVELRRFRIVGTGHALPEECCHIGTVQDGPFVWHLFELLGSGT